MDTEIQSDPQQVECPDASNAAEIQTLSSPKTGTKRDHQNNYCDLCTFDDLQEDAVGFCINCTDFLCKSCLVNHKRIKVTRSHTVLQGEDMPADVEPFIALRAMVKCEFHVEYDIAYMCAEHSIHICAICVTDKHRMCKLERISALNNEEDPRKEPLMVESLLNLETRIEQFASKLERYVSRMQEDQKRVITEAQDIAQQLIENIVTLTKNVEDKTTELVNIETNITITNINEANSLHREIRKIKDLLQTAQKYGSSEERILASRHFDVTSKEIMRKMGSLETCEEKYFTLDKYDQIHKFDSLCNITFASGETNGSEIENASDEVVELLESHEFGEHTDTRRTVRDIGTQYESSVVKCNEGVQTLNIACAFPPTLQNERLRLTLPCILTEAANMRSTSHFMERWVNQTADIYNIETPNDAFDCCVTAIKMFSDGKILLADRWNNKLKLLSTEFAVLDEYQLTGYPIDVCLVDDDIYVCCSDEKQVSRFLIDGDGNLCKTGGYPTRHWPVSLSHFDKRVIILLLKQGGCFDADNAEDVTIEIRNGSRIDAVLHFGTRDDASSCSDDNDNDHAYIEDAKRILTLETGSVLLAEDDRVSCYATDEDANEMGDREWYYKYYGPNPLQNARGLATDAEGNVYICCEDSNNVHQVSSVNYRKNRVLISEIDKPCSVCVDHERDRLIVGCNGDNFLHVFDFS